MLSLTLLGGEVGRVVFGPWRARARSELTRLPSGQLRLLRYLAPPRGDFPDFLTPPQASQGFEAGIDAVLATPRHRLRQEVAMLPGRPSWGRALADGQPEIMTELGEALRNYHHAVIAPYWPRMQALVDAERAVHTRPLLDHGSEKLLSNLGPAMRWNSPVLEIDYPLRHEIHLNGRGLLMVPSAFCWRYPITLIDPRLPPVLVFPVARTPDWWGDCATANGSRTLANLLGSSRAACLRAIEHGCTTGELARRIGVSPPTASQHATALREAGLITTARLGNSVIHTLTPLGTAILTVNPASDRRRLAPRS
ncbi:winged helix-turn-helix domain-containing protein [Sphaerisporangium flaviroseum]|uniref:Winged helix-turn-helix domain-containing protein n=1 Tax=Sphaerisporangium flaviroseum TaxID=509199 RepID=A0ABP7ISB4_9ACTN